MAEKKENNFLVKIDKVRKKSYAGFMLLKQDDIIVALNNQFYTFGETKLTEELKDLILKQLNYKKESHYLEIGETGLTKNLSTTGG